MVTVGPSILSFSKAGRYGQSFRSVGRLVDWFVVRADRTDLLAGWVAGQSVGKFGR